MVFMAQLEPTARVVARLARRVGKVSAHWRRGKPSWSAWEPSSQGNEESNSRRPKGRVPRWCCLGGACGKIVNESALLKKRGDVGHAREAGDENAREGDEDAAGDDLAGEGDADSAGDDLADELDDGAVEEDLATTEAVDDPHAGEGHGKLGEERQGGCSAPGAQGRDRKVETHVDGGENDLSDEGVADA